MSSTNTYSAFHCNGTIVVMHHQGLELPETLMIFREPQRMAIHEGKLVGFYSLSDHLVTLLDDPRHDAGAVLNAIALPLKKRSIKIPRSMKYLSCIVAGALMASVVLHQWMPAPPVNLDIATKTAMTAIPAPYATSSSRMDKNTPIRQQQNMQAVIQSNQNTLPASPAAALQPLSPANPPVAPDISQQTNTVRTAQEISPRQQMADVLRRNAARGMFTITLSTGHERTLYAFLDPTCAACRMAEPAIEQLTKVFNVIIFPVSVVNDGGGAVDKIVPLLCQKDPARRAGGWLSLFSADSGMAVPGNTDIQPVDATCAKAAAAAVAVNDLGFRQFGFGGTPWVLTDTGYHLPTGLLSDPSKIDLFLKTTDSMTSVQADTFLKTVRTQE